MLCVQRIGDTELPAPRRQTIGAAGYDLCAAEAAVLMPYERRLIGTGFAWAIPDFYVGLIRPRSGLALRDGAHVMAGVIDADFRGEVKVLLINMDQAKPLHIEAGERIAQMIVVPIWGDTKGEPPVVDHLPDTYRGGGGFGSTGT